MAARSEALAAKGWIDPTKLGKFRVVLSDSLRGKPSSEIYTAVQYNHKPALSTGKPPTSAQLEASHSNDASSYDLSFDGGGGGGGGGSSSSSSGGGGDQYAYKGTRSTEKGKYALVFDKKTRTFVLHEVDSTFKMNLVETPTNKDAESLKERFPYLKRTKGGGIEKRKRMEIKKRKMPEKTTDKGQERMASSGGGSKSSEATTKEARSKDAAASKANPLISKKHEKSKAAAQKAAAASQKLQAPQSMTHPLPPKPPPIAHGYSGKSSSSSSRSNNSAAASAAGTGTSTTTTATAATGAAAAGGASSSSMLPPPLPRSRPGQAAPMAPPPRPKGSSMSPPPGSGGRREEIPLPPKPQFTNLPNKKAAKASMSPPPAPDRDRSPDAAVPSRTGKGSSKTAKGPKAAKASKNAKASLPLPPRPASSQEAEEPAAAADSKKKKNKKPVKYESDEDEDDDDGGLVVEFPGGPSSSKSFGNKNDFSPAFPPPVPIRPFSEFEREAPDEEEEAVDDDLEQEFEAVFNEVDQDDDEKNLANFKLPSPVNNGSAGSNGGPEVAVDDDELEREFMMDSDESEISEEE